MRHRCVFLGLSMTDINLLRWLALRALERDRDEFEGNRRAAWVGHGFRSSLRRQFMRHFWIRPDSDDRGQFLSEFLALRGVQAVPIADWDGNSLHRLLQKCFP